MRLALRNFRNKSGFHECPRCKSRSVWKADPQNMLEDTLHALLRVSPYRCARCDMRFMDAKIASDTSSKTKSSWWATATQAFSRRSPFDDPLRLDALGLGLSKFASNRDASTREAVAPLTKAKAS